MEIKVFIVGATLAVALGHLVVALGHLAVALGHRQADASTMITEIMIYPFISLPAKFAPNVKYTLENHGLTRRRFGRILATIPKWGINCV